MTERYAAEHEWGDGCALRPGRPTDTPGVIELIDAVYAEYDVGLDLDGFDRHLLDPGAYFRESGGEFWVVDAGGVVAATAAVKLHADAGELKTLYVHRDRRGRGWGRRLTQLAIDYARQAGKPRFFLWSDTRFLDAHRLYRSMGFVQGGERELHDLYDTVEYGFELPTTPENQT